MPRFDFRIAPRMTGKGAAVRKLSRDSGVDR
jgi:hypothetical protein